MFDITVKGDECIIPIEQMIELLKCRLDALKEARDKDSSWNYGIDELEQQIKEIKEKV